MPYLIYASSDSINVKFIKCYLSEHAATLTKAKAKTTFKYLAQCSKKERWGALDPATMTFKQMCKYVLYRRSQGLGTRSIQNETSIIRRALAAVGRRDFAQVTCSNNALEVGVGTRKGTGKVVDPHVLHDALENALPNTKAMIGLSRYLGLRIREAVKANNSLGDWHKALSLGRPIIVRDGTKGGKARSVVIAPKFQNEALEAITLGLKVLETQNYLVVSKNLKSAVGQHSDRLARLGLKGKNSCHSLRRAFALDQFLHYLSIGHSEKTALSWTSNDLGHGDTRGRWIMNNYIKNSL